MAEKEIYVNFDITEEQRAFTPSEKEKSVVTDVYLKFSNSQQDRDRNFEFFDSLNLIDYINDSVRRFTTNLDEREDIEDWQSRINTQFTRNKVLAILGKVVSVLPIAKFNARGDEDIRKSNILTNLYEYAEDADDYEELMTHVLLEAIVKGTAIGYEGVDKKKRMLRDVSGTGDDLKVTEVEETTTKLFGSIVQLEEFYPSSVSIRTIKKMPYCFWRKVIPYSQFIQSWDGIFTKASLVQPKRTYHEDEERPFYADMVTNDIGDGNVEIIRYYDKERDQYVFLANGIWLNPISDKDGNEEISPLPFKHKELPFWDIKFDFFGDFFYGKSLPDRLKTMQDTLNVLTNMLLDQSFLTIFPPLLTNGYDSIEDDYLRPGRRTPIDTQGLPINQAFMKLDLGTPSGWHQYILEYTKSIMEEASVDQVTQGVAGVGERTTAKEISVAAEGVSAILGIFARMVNYGIKRKAMLKGANILQFWADPKSPMIERIGGDDGNEEFNKAFNTFKLNNAVLSTGKRGTKIIELYKDKEDIPTRKENEARAVVQKIQSDVETEVDSLPGEYIRNFLFDVELVSNPKSEKSKDLERAIQLEKVQVYMTYFPQVVNVQELAAETAEKLGDDPTKILTDDVFKTAPVQEATQGTPGNNVQNQVQSGRGGQPGAAEMASLSNNLQG